MKHIALIPLIALGLAACQDVVLSPENENVPDIPARPDQVAPQTHEPVGATFTVNTTDDVDDGACDANHCSLREAITAANASASRDKIAFHIPGRGPHTIQPTSALPTITDSVIIDGYTQPGARPNSNTRRFGSNAVLKIELDGTKAGTEVNGLLITAGSSTVRGLVINRFVGTFPLGSGIRLETNGGNVIEGNFIGTDVTGTAALPNSFGVSVGFSASNNIVGGTTPGAENVISGNNSIGVVLFGSGTTGNLVQGNFIGTDVTGTVALPNSFGVSISGAPNNTIGGTSVGARNIMSGNDFHGIGIGGIATGNQIEGNFIGTDVTGTVKLGNLNGVVISSDASNNTIGGTNRGAGNVISGNSSNGVVLSGFQTGATGNLVQGNFIGTQVDGTGPLGNASSGVFLTLANDNTIGGRAAGASNTIAFNNDGVFVFSGTGNAILSNSIFSNTGLGIDLLPGGVTANDAGDGDTGANNLMNFPVLTSAVVEGGRLTVTGTIDTPSPETVTVQFFANPVPTPGGDPSGQGEGARFLGNVRPSPAGEFTRRLPRVPVGTLISATATDADGNTSEFAANVEAQGARW